MGVPPLDALPVGVDLIHIGSYGSFSSLGAQEVLNVMSHARAAGATVTFDPNVRPQLLRDRDRALTRIELARHVTIVKMSDEDQDRLYPGSSRREVVQHQF